MQVNKKIIWAVLGAAVFVSSYSLPVFAAISESDVQAQVTAAGKEATAGNVLVWFLCAVAFLKVSQKIDSFMSSLGINVGHTGGSMMAEALLAAKGFGSLQGLSGAALGGGLGRIFGRGHTSGSGAPAGGSGKAGNTGGFMAGGLAGVVSRSVTQSAIRSATASSSHTSSSAGRSSSGGLGGLISGASGGIGGQIYAASAKTGGVFANDVIRTIATGRIADAGTMTGEKAAEALSSYMGYAALGEGAENVPQFHDVEIGGGRITGTEVSEEHPEGTAFGMYHAAQYAAPEGTYSTVRSADGETWYKQYAADAVERSPYMAPDGSIAYKESIVKKLPPVPRRKDRL